jgi:hypothetical protein
MSEISDAAKARFNAKVETGTGGCELWIGQKTHRGYGRFWLNGRMEYAHRVALALDGRTVPDGMVVDHLCRTRDCVNPAHLEIVKQQENVRRGLSAAARTLRAQQTTHCKNGHPWSDENTRLSGGQRVCRACDRAKTARAKAKRMEARHD